MQTKSDPTLNFEPINKDLVRLIAGFIIVPAFAGTQATGQHLETLNFQAKRE
jgi:hypothetical protein